MIIFADYRDYNYYDRRSDSYDYCTAANHTPI